MSTVHISEEDAEASLQTLLARASTGEQIVIDMPGSSVRLVPNQMPQGRTGHEMLAILNGLPGERGVMDETFAADVRSFRACHPEGLDGTKWD